MRKYISIIVFAVLMLCSVSANAVELSGETVVITPGKTAVVTLDITGVAGQKTCDAIVEVPEGITILEDEEEEEFFTIGNACTKRYSVNIAKWYEEGKRVFTSTYSNRFSDELKDGVLFTFTVQADESFKGSKVITLSKIFLALDENGNGNNLDDVEIAIMDEATAADTVKGTEKASSDVRKVAKNNKLYIVKGETEINVAGAAMK